MSDNITLDATWIRNKKGSGMVMYQANWFALDEIYLGDAGHAKEMIDYGFTHYDPSGIAFTEARPYRPYYHDGSLAYIMCIASMALQSSQGVISLFPAVPKEWKDIAFYGLPAESGYLVSGELKNGKLLWASFSKNGKEELKITENKIVKISNDKGKTSLKLVK
jgi:hypothetical protein